MPDSGNYDLYGRIALVIGSDGRVLGSLDNGGKRFELRGEITPSGYFTGVLDGPVDYRISGTITSTRASEDAVASWTIDGEGDENDQVSFRLGDC